MFGELPGLAPAEIERLAILAGDCGHVAESIEMVLRFGWESCSPYGGPLNRDALERRIGNLRASVNRMMDEGDIRLDQVQAWQRSKRVSQKKWTLYQADSMPREDQLAMMAAIAERRRPVTK